MKSSQGPTRRNAIEGLAAQAALFAAFSAALRANAASGPAGREVHAFVQRVEMISAAARAGALSAPEWGNLLHMATRDIAVADLAAAIDFSRIAAATPIAKRGVATAAVRLPAIDGVGAVVHTKIFAVDRGRAIIPHGHVGMASGHLVMQGAFYRRQYDRIAIEDDDWILRQSHDAHDGPGTMSWISDAVDNAHWLIAEAPSYTLDFILAPLRPGGSWDVQNLDLDAATPLANGDLRAPTIGVEEALAKYG